ncbi:MAG: restriction endonuclease subunit R, partial [Candidatus Omnitrophica bacterium]|nr:restriction endonuclease subunit R [Candidatus Omnitrophota bacterium]
IGQRKKTALDYEEYLRKIVELTQKIKNPASGESYPSSISTPAKQALYDNLEHDETLALSVHAAVRANRQDDWMSNVFKVRKVRNAVREALGGDEDLTDEILELVKNQDEY